MAPLQITKLQHELPSGVIKHGLENPPLSWLIFQPHSTFPKHPEGSRRIPKVHTKANQNQGIASASTHTEAAA
jgi:hypothetical protein